MNLGYALVSSRLWDRADGRNRGVTGDRQIVTREALLLRIVCYTDPASGECFEFLTNAMELPPGVIAE